MFRAYPASHLLTAGDRHQDGWMGQKLILPALLLEGVFQIKLILFFCIHHWLPLCLGYVSRTGVQEEPVSDYNTDLSK